MEEELNQLVLSFNRNGYKENQTRKIMKISRGASRGPINVSRDKNRVFLPYIKGLLDNLTRIQRKRDINVSFSPINTIREMIDLAKHLIDLSFHNGFCAIPCSCCKVYIGEIGRSMNMRLKEFTYTKGK